MTVVRYLVFAFGAAVVAAALFFVLNLGVSASRDASTGVFEGWIERALCADYDLRGSVRTKEGAPIAFAVVEAAYLERRLRAISDTEGRYRLVADNSACTRETPSVLITVGAANYLQHQQDVRFELETLDVALERSGSQPP